MYLLGNYWFTFKSISVDAELQQEDNNVWNDKNTSDGLKYLQQEVFTFCYYFSFLLSDAVIRWTVIPQFKTQTFNEVMYLNIAYTLLIADKFVILLNNLYYMTNGVTIPAQVRFYIWCTVKVLRTILLGGLIALFVITDNFKN